MSYTEITYNCGLRFLMDYYPWPRREWLKIYRNKTCSGLYELRGW